MAITRRHFLDLCKDSAVALGIGSVCLANIEELFAGTTAPTAVELSIPG